MPWTHPQTGIVYQCQDDKCLAGKTDDTWRKFMLLTGRGFGKTEAGSNWLVDQAIKNPNTTWGVAAPTEGDLFKTCFNGDSGLLAQLREGELSDYNMNRHTVKLSNGSEIRGFTVDNPQRIRGANLHGLWIDEIAASIRGEEFLKYTALAAVRLGRSQIVFTTTPQPTPLMRKLVGGAFGKIHVTRGSMYENTALSEDAVEDLRKTFLGSRVGRQELEGELLDEFEGALFNRKDLDDYRILPGMKVPKYANIVVGFDPAMKSGEESDESGIVVVASAEMNDGFDHAFILDDQSIRGTPAEVAKRVAIAAQTWEASCVYYESNQGGDWIKDSLRSIDPTLPCREAHSSRGKIMRAEPVSALCEAGRIHMVGTFIELEEELCIMRPNAKSKGGDDDRSDAMIHAVWGLKLVSYGSYTLAYGQITCAGCDKLYFRGRQSCPHCGLVREVIMEEQERPPRGSWADAYMDICRRCGNRFPKHSQCAKCDLSAQAFMAQVAVLTGNPGGNTGKHGYMGRDWLSGRKT
jgi:phage terminase large subunit-like protein